jgi:hypothetical protein
MAATLQETDAVPALPPIPSRPRGFIKRPSAYALGLPDQGPAYDRVSENADQLDPLLLLVLNKRKSPG